MGGLRRPLGSPSGPAELIACWHRGPAPRRLGLPAHRRRPGAHLGDGDVIAAAARAQFSGAGVNGAVGGSEAARAGGARGLHALQPSLKLSNLK